MKKLINKSVALVLCALATMLSLSSCADQDDINISYDLETGITAAHIFDGFEPYRVGDFDMATDGWKLNLQVLVYDKDGVLVEQAEKKCSSIRESLQFTPSLVPGEYTVVSIADFREGLGGPDYKFWYIRNTSRLEDLTIIENEDIYPDVFETLGLDIQKITIEGKPVQLAADIKPYTALVHVYENNDDHLGYGTNGYSRFVPVCAGYFIRSSKMKNRVKVEDENFTSYYTEQTSDYNVSISTVLDDWLDRENPLKHSYRALLPDKDCSFTWHIQKMEYEPDDVFNQFAGNLITDGTGSRSIDLKSGGQYVINMVLDILSMDVLEYPSEFKAYDYSQAQVDEYIEQKFDEMMFYNYESMLGKDDNFVNTFLSAEPNEYKWSGELYLADYSRPGIDRLEIERTVGYLNVRKKCAVIVQFLLPSLSDEVLDYFRQKLSAKYRIDMEYTSPDNYAYIDPDVNTDTRYRIVLQKKVHGSKSYYFLNYILREKYTPAEEYENVTGEEEVVEEPGTLGKIFPFDWDTFLRKDIAEVKEAVGSNYSDGQSSVTYNDYNSLLRFVSFGYDSDNKVNTITVDTRYSENAEEIDAVVTDYLSSRFTLLVGSLYVDATKSMTVLYMNGRLTYNIR